MKHPDYLGIAILTFCLICWVQGFLVGWSMRFSVDGIREEWRRLRELWRGRG